MHGVPEKITIDKSGSNTAAILGIQADSGRSIEMLQSKYRNNLVEQDHRASNRSLGRRSASKPFAASESLSPASKSCT